MILRLRIPNKLFVCTFSVTGAAVVTGAVWTFHQGAGVPSNVPTFVVPVATNGNHHRAKSTVGRGSSIGRGTARGKSGRGDRYVSQMLTLAAGYTLPFRLEDRNLGFGANEVDGFVNEVQKEGKLDSFKDVSFNLGHLVVAGGGKIAAFAEDPSIPPGARPPNGDGGPVHNIHPSPSVPLVAPFPLSVLLPAPSPLLVPFPLSFLLPAPSPLLAPFPLPPRPFLIPGAPFC